MSIFSGQIHNAIASTGGHAAGGALSSAAGGFAAGGPVGAAIALGSSLISGLFGKGSNRKAYHRSKKLMDKQFNMDKQMWDYQNAYNTPAQQMARLKSAGLNPALMYGQGNTGNASQMPQSKFTELRPYMGPADIAQTTAAGVQMSLANAQKEQIKENTMYTKIKGANETRNSLQQAALQNEQTRKTRQETSNAAAQKFLIIAQEKESQARRRNERLRGQILKLDSDWLKKNKTSTYDMQLIRALKGIGMDLWDALKWYLNNRDTLELAIEESGIKL
jgi:hypothetical protein